MSCTASHFSFDTPFSSRRQRRRWPYQRCIAWCRSWCHRRGSLPSHGCASILREVERQSAAQHVCSCLYVAASVQLGIAMVPSATALFERDPLMPETVVPSSCRPSPRPVPCVLSWPRWGAPSPWPGYSHATWIQYGMARYAMV